MKQGGICVVFDFSEPMSAYECLAITLSAIALIFPVIKWAWNKWVCRAKISFLPSDLVSIFFNKSGSYISFGGVYSVKNKSATVESISATITRRTDKAVLDLRWSSFSSPIYRRIAGTYETSFETAHPFKVDVDNLAPVFVEFEVKEQEAVGKLLSPAYYATTTIFNSNPSISIIDADHQLRCTPEYKESFTKINDLFFWKPGKYQIMLKTDYNKQRATYLYEFELTENESNQLRANIDYLLTTNLILHYGGQAPILNMIRKDFKEVQ